jgi:hypothetical protein
VTGRGGPLGGVEFGLPRVHYESQDSWVSTVSCCRDWRARIELSALDGHGHASDVVVGHVDFLIVRTGVQPIAEVLALFGARAAAFGELFAQEWLAADLEENDDFTAGMPIGAVLIVLDARLDPAASDAPVRPWVVAEVINTMLPTTAGLVAMSAHVEPGVGGHSRRLVSADQIDRDWERVGCAPIPGRPQLVGRSTAYVHLDAARTALAHVGDHVVHVTDG